MILQLLFYAELETLKMQFKLEKLGPPLENFWVRHCERLYTNNAKASFKCRCVEGTHWNRTQNATLTVLYKSKEVFLSKPISESTL